MNSIELLKTALDDGIISLDVIAAQVKMREEQKYLSMHCYKIYKDKNGKYNTYLPGDGSRKLVRKSSRDDLERVVIDYYKKQEKAYTMEDAFYGWLGQKLEYGDIQKQTADRYETAFIRYLSHTDLSDVSIDCITESDLEILIKKTIHDMELTYKAWGDMRLLILGIFKYAKKMGKTDISISQFMGDLEISRKAFTRRRFTDDESVFTDDEVELIVCWINAQEPSIINYGIVLAFQTGLRAGELVALKPGDINGNVMTVARTEVRYKNEDGVNVHAFRECTKGRDGSRQIILTQSALDTIARIREISAGEYLFMTDGKNLQGKAFTAKLYKICDKVGIRRRSLHKARKTYATKLLNAGISERIIINQMGHTDISTTKSFYYFNNKRKDDIEKLLAAAIG